MLYPDGKDYSMLGYQAQRQVYSYWYGNLTYTDVLSTGTRAEDNNGQWTIVSEEGQYGYYGSGYDGDVSLDGTELTWNIDQISSVQTGELYVDSCGQDTSVSGGSIYGTIGQEETLSCADYSDYYAPVTLDRWLVNLPAGLVRVSVDWPINAGIDTELIVTDTSSCVVVQTDSDFACSNSYYGDYCPGAEFMVAAEGEYSILVSSTGYYGYGCEDYYSSEGSYHLKVASNGVEVLPTLVDDDVNRYETVESGWEVSGSAALTPAE